MPEVCIIVMKRVYYEPVRAILRKGNADDG